MAPPCSFTFGLFINLLMMNLLVQLVEVHACFFPLVTLWGGRGKPIIFKIFFAVLFFCLFPGTQSLHNQMSQISCDDFFLWSVNLFIQFLAPPCPLLFPPLSTVSQFSMPTEFSVKDFVQLKLCDCSQRTLSQSGVFKQTFKFDSKLAYRAKFLR